MILWTDLVWRDAESSCNAGVEFFDVCEVLYLFRGAPVRQLTVEYQLLPGVDDSLAPSGGRASSPGCWGRGSWERGRGRSLLAQAPRPGSLAVLGTSLAPRLLLATEDGHPNRDDFSSERMNCETFAIYSWLSPDHSPVRRLSPLHPPTTTLSLQL